MKKIISAKNAPSATGPFSQAVECNGILFVSGQVAINPSTGKIVDGGIKEQAEQVLLNIKAILNEAGYELSNVVKSTCLLKNMDDYAVMNEVYSKFFQEDSPARAAYEVVKLPLNALIEIETIAMK